jgi:hypothetical protein
MSRRCEPAGHLPMRRGRQPLRVSGGVTAPLLTDPTARPEALNNCQYLIPRIMRDQQRPAIEGPVAVGGGTIALRLVQRLLNDVGDDPDQLPVLQHALMRTWEAWRKERPAG